MTDQLNILAIETATSACSVALSIGDTIFERSEIGNNIHSQKLLGMVEAVLGEAQLDVSELTAVAVGQGPGSFTGLRIGIGVAQGIAFGAGCEMLGISSLAALALQANSGDYILTGIDARMNEVYWGLYKRTQDGVKLIGELQVSSVDSIDVEKVNLIDSDFLGDNVVLIGNAWAVYENEIKNSLLSRFQYLESGLYPYAKDVLKLAHQAYLRKELVAPAEFIPQYVRNNVAVKKSI